MILVVAPEEPLILTAAEPGTTLEAALGGGPLRPLEGRLTAPGDGDHWLAVAARDEAGNLSAIRWIFLRVDTEPPRLRLEFEPAAVEGEAGGRWLPPGARGKLWAEDAPAGVARVFVTSGEPGAGDAVFEAEGSEITTALPAAGEARLRGWAEDRVGHRSTIEEITAAVDAEPPRCRIYGRGPWLETATAAVLGPGAVLEAEVEDGGSGVARRRYFLDDGETAVRSWQGPWLPGPHRAELAVVDRVGNEGRCRLPFLFDTEPPELSWRLDAAAVASWEGRTVYRPPVSVVVGAEDGTGVARVEWSQDGEAFEPVPEEWTTSLASVVFRATDRVGNRGEAKASWNLDAEPPRIRLRLPNGTTAEPDAMPQILFGQTVGLDLEDAGSGVAFHRVWLNGSPLPTARVIEFESGGTHRLEVEAVDGVGNRRRSAWQVQVRRGRR